MGEHTASRAGLISRAGPQRNCLWMSHVVLSFVNLLQKQRATISLGWKHVLLKVLPWILCTCLLTTLWFKKKDAQIIEKTYFIKPQKSCRKYVLHWCLLM